MYRLFPSVFPLLFAALTLSIQPSAQADSFGTSGNEFTVDFVNIGHVGNAADTTGFGAVPYQYRVSTYEISQDAINKATASGLANVTAGAWTGNQPAADISWYEAAAFVNWMNTSTGKQAAYDLTFSGDNWTMTLWSSAEARSSGRLNCSGVTSSRICRRSFLVSLRPRRFCSILMISAATSSESSGSSLKSAGKPGFMVWV
jgi:hypothetical protein